MSREFTIRLNQRLTRLPEESARDFLSLLERNGVLREGQATKILELGKFDFHTVLDHFGRVSESHLSFTEFAHSPLGQNFRDLPQFIRWAQQLGLQDIFRGFVNSAREQARSPELSGNASLLFFLGWENPRLFESALAPVEPIFWINLLDERGISVYLNAPRAVQLNEELARYALRASVQADQLRATCQVLLGQPVLDSILHDEPFYLGSVLRNPRLVAFLPASLLRRHNFLLSLCRLNFNVLNYLSADQVDTASLWRILLAEAGGRDFEHLNIHSHGELMDRLHQCGMSDTGRLHSLRAALHLIASQESVIRGERDSRSPVYLMFSDPSADEIGFFPIHPDLDNLLLNSSSIHRFVYFEASTSDDVFERLEYFSNALPLENNHRQKGALIWAAHADELGIRLSVDPVNGRVTYFNAFSFTSDRSLSPYVSGMVYLASCGSGEYHAQAFAAANPGIPFVGPDRSFEGASMSFDPQGKLVLNVRAYEQMLYSKAEPQLN